MTHTCDKKVVIDARGLTCPLPVLRLRKKIMEGGQSHIFQLLTTDPASWQDVVQFCQQTGHELMEREKLPEHFVFLVKKHTKNNANTP